MLNRHLIKRSLAGGLVIAAASWPAAAEARFLVDPPAGSEAPIISVSSSPQPSSHSSFQWGDAGIGAAGAAVLLGAGALGASVARRRRHPIVD